MASTHSPKVHCFISQNASRVGWGSICFKYQWSDSSSADQSIWQCPKVCMTKVYTTNTRGVHRNISLCTLVEKYFALTPATCNLNSYVALKFIFRGSQKTDLDQVYCAWLIKWVIKRESIQLAELCLTRWWIISGTWWYWVRCYRCLTSHRQQNIVLLSLYTV